MFGYLIHPTSHPGRKFFRILEFIPCFVGKSQNIRQTRIFIKSLTLNVRFVIIYRYVNKVNDFFFFKTLQLFYISYFRSELKTLKANWREFREYFYRKKRRKSRSGCPETNFPEEFYRYGTKIVNTWLQHTLILDWLHVWTLCC